MSYQIVYDRPAVKFLRRQSKEVQERLLAAIHKLPAHGDIKPLSGFDGLYRLRVGSFRVIYTVENSILTVRVLEIGNRGDVYK